MNKFKQVVKLELGSVQSLEDSDCACVFKVTWPTAAPPGCCVY